MVDTTLILWIGGGLGVVFLLFMIIDSINKAREARTASLIAKIGLKKEILTARHEDRFKNIFTTVFFTLILLQGVGMVVSNFLNINIKLGVPLVLSIAAFAVWVVVRYLSAYEKGVTKEQWTLMIISLVLAIGIMIFIPVVAPQIFSTAIPEMQSALASMIGLG